MSGKPVDWGAVNRVRLGHTKWVLRDRYGKYEVPDDDAGNDDLCIFLHVKASAHKPERREKALYNEITLWAPWMPAEDARRLAAEVASNPIKFTSASLGQRLNVDSATRDRLRVWQIGATNFNAEIAKERKRERRRQWDRERKRKQRNRRPRAEYLANSKENTKPWLAMGISRRTYYYRQSKGDCTGVSAKPALKLHRCVRTSNSNNRVDTLVQRQKRRNGQGVRGGKARLASVCGDAGDVP